MMRRSGYRTKLFACALGILLAASELPLMSAQALAADETGESGCVVEDHDNSLIASLSDANDKVDSALQSEAVDASTLASAVASSDDDVETLIDGQAKTFYFDEGTMVSGNLRVVVEENSQAKFYFATKNNSSMYVSIENSEGVSTILTLCSENSSKTVYPVILPKGTYTLFYYSGKATSSVFSSVTIGYSTGGVTYPDDVLEFELNGDAESATELGSLSQLNRQSKFRGTIYVPLYDGTDKSVYDSDWYHFSLSESNAVSIQLSAGTPVLYALVDSDGEYVTDSLGNTVVGRAGKQPVATSCFVGFLSAGDYYLEILGDIDDSDVEAGKVYTGSVEMASSVAEDGTFSGSYRSSGSSSYWIFESDGERPTTVSLSSMSDMVTLSVVDSSGSIAHYNGDSSKATLKTYKSVGGGKVNLQLSCGILPKGTYMVKLTPSPSSSGKGYSGTVEQTTFTDVLSTTAHSEDIEWLASSGISTGWTESDGTRTFRPFTGVVRADMAAFLYRMAGSPEYTAPDVSPFADVNTSTAHYKEICWLAESGISQGWTESDGSKTFRPYTTVVRADMAAFLYRLTGSPDYEVSGKPFADCGSSTAHYKEVCWLASTGVSQGWTESDGTKTFRPYTTVVRADMAAFLHRMKTKGLV